MRPCEGTHRLGRYRAFDHDVGEVLQQRAANRVVDDHGSKPEGRTPGRQRSCLESLEEAGLDVDDVVVETKVKRFRIVAEPEKVADYPEAAIGAGQLLYLAARIGRGEFAQIAPVAFVAAIVPQLPFGDVPAAEDIVSKKAQITLPAGRRDDHQLHSTIL